MVEAGFEFVFDFLGVVAGVGVVVSSFGDGFGVFGTQAAFGEFL